MSELVPGDFPFPLAEPRPGPGMITRPCGCTSMTVDDDDAPVQISWCADHDPGYAPPEGEGTTDDRA